MSIALVANVAKQGTSSSTGASADIDTTGANFLAVSGCDLAATTLSDSKGNTFQARTTHDSGASVHHRIYDCQNATVGSGHNFTLAGTASFPALAAAAFSGVATSNAFDQENGANNGSTATTCTTGSVTPSEDNELLFYGWGDAWATISSIDVGTIINQLALVGGTAFAIASAYQIQTTATTRNVTATFNASARAVGSIATYKQAAGGAVVGTGLTTGLKLQRLRLAA